MNETMSRARLSMLLGVVSASNGRCLTFGAAQLAAGVQSPVHGDLAEWERLLGAQATEPPSACDRPPAPVIPLSGSTVNSRRHPLSQGASKVSRQKGASVYEVTKGQTKAHASTVPWTPEAQSRHALRRDG